MLAFFAQHSQDDTEAYVHAALANTDFWGQDLSALDGVEQAVAADLKEIRTLGMRQAMEKLFG